LENANANVNANTNANAKQPRVSHWNINNPLDFKVIFDYPHGVPKKAHKILPKFSWDNVISANHDFDKSWKVIYELDVEHEDVFMNFLLQP